MSETFVLVPEDVYNKMKENEQTPSSSVEQSKEEVKSSTVIGKGDHNCFNPVGWITFERKYDILPNEFSRNYKILY